MLAAASTLCAAAADHTLLYGSTLIPVSGLLRYERRRGLSSSCPPPRLAKPCRGHEQCLKIGQECLRPTSSHRPNVSRRELNDVSFTSSLRRRSLHQSSRKAFWDLFRDDRGSRRRKQKKLQEKEAFKPLSPAEQDGLIARAFEHSKEAMLSPEAVLDNIMRMDSFYATTNNLAWKNVILARLKSSCSQKSVPNDDGTQRLVYSIRAVAVPGSNVSPVPKSRAALRRPVPIQGLSSTLPARLAAKTLDRPNDGVDSRQPSKLDRSVQSSIDAGESSNEQQNEATPERRRQEAQYMEESLRQLRDRARLRKLEAEQAERQRLEQERLSEIKRCAARRASELERFETEIGAAETELLGISHSRDWRYGNAVEILRQHIEDYVSQQRLAEKMEMVERLSKTVSETLEQTSEELQKVSEPRLRYWAQLKNDVLRMEDRQDAFKFMRTKEANQIMARMRSAVENMFEDITFTDRSHRLFNWRVWTSSTTEFGHSKGPLRLILIHEILQLGIDDISETFHILRHRIWVRLLFSAAPEVYRHLISAARAEYALDFCLSDWKRDFNLINKTAPHIRAVTVDPRVQLRENVLYHGAVMQRAGQTLGHLYEMVLRRGLGIPRNPLERYLSAVLGSAYLYHINEQALYREAYRCIKKRGGSILPPLSKPSKREYLGALQIAKGALAAGWLYRSTIWESAALERWRPKPDSLQKLEDSIFSYSPIIAVPPSNEGEGKPLALPQMQYFYPQHRAVPVHYIFTPQTLHHALESFNHPGVLGIAVDTASSAVLENFLVLANESKVVIFCISIPQRTIRPELLGDYGYGRLTDLICNPDIRKVGFNVEDIRARVDKTFGCDGEGFVELGSEGDEGATRPVTKSRESLPNSKSVEIVRKLALRAFTALKVYRDRHGYHDGESTPGEDTSEDDSLLAPQVAFGPLYLDPADRLKSNSSTGFVNSLIPTFKSRTDCILVMSRELAIQVILDKFRGLDRSRMLQTIDVGAKSWVAQGLGASRRSAGFILAVRHIQRLSSFKSWTAYCLATSFNEGTEAIGKCLGITSPARAILQLVKAVDLPLHNVHRSRLEEAQIHEPRLKDTSPINAEKGWTPFAKRSLLRPEPRVAQPDTRPANTLSRARQSDLSRRTPWNKWRVMPRRVLFWRMGREAGEEWRPFGGRRVPTPGHREPRGRHRSVSYVPPARRFDLVHRHLKLGAQSPVTPEQDRVTQSPVAKGQSKVDMSPTVPRKGLTNNQTFGTRLGASSQLNPGPLAEHPLFPDAQPGQDSVSQAHKEATTNKQRRNKMRWKKKRVKKREQKKVRENSAASIGRGERKPDA